MKPTAVMILSSGIDSAVNLAWALQEYDFRIALTFDYGQRAAKQEIHHAYQLASHYGISHQVVRLPFLASQTNTSLVNPGKKLPRLSEELLENREFTEASAQAVWVPNRNGIFINISAAFAESFGSRHVTVGFNEEEGATFPDNTPAFLEAVNQSLFYSTRNHVTVLCKTLFMRKTEILRKGLALKLPFEFIWSCYEGGETMCGLCESCLRLKRAAAAEAPHLLDIFFNPKVKAQKC